MINNYSYNEFKTISDCLLELYEISDLQQLLQTFLDDIGALIPYKQSVFYAIGADDGEISREGAVFINTEKRFHDVFFGSYDDEHNYLLTRFKYKHSNVFSENDIFEEEAFIRTSFYKEFMAPQKLLYSCGIILIKNERPIGVVNLFRGRDWGDFNDKEKGILDIFKDHLTNMLYAVSMGRNNISVIDDGVLTDREREIAQLIILGYSNEEISSNLCISLSTTKKHVYNIFNKYGVSSRMALIRHMSGK